MEGVPERVRRGTVDTVYIDSFVEKRSKEMRRLKEEYVSSGKVVFNPPKDYLDPFISISMVY